MPLDPFFTSGVSLPVKARIHKRKRKVVEVLNPAKTFARKIARQGGYFIKNSPSLTGFKPPEKKWDER